MIKKFAFLFSLIPVSLFSETEVKSPLSQFTAELDILWVILAAALVFFMQVGFLMLETGLVRVKNSINVAVKNLIDYVLGTITFFLVGFALMFGSSYSGVFGSSLFLLDGLSTGKDFTFFLFQLTFMGTAATIVSGAVSERMKFNAYLISTLVVTTIIYPVFGHWAWGGGWLSHIGFVDFAGSTVVHSVGGWVALAGAIVLGPRLGKFNDDGKPNHFDGHNLPISVAGTFILWFGWFGFNGGSTLKFDDSVPFIIVNTTLAAAAGGCFTTLVPILLLQKRPQVENMINGVLGGLVGITAGCAYVNTHYSILIGFLSGILVLIVSYLMENKFHFDDVVGAYAVHGACGALGTIVIPFFCKPEFLPVVSGKTLTRLDFLLSQLIGIFACFLWSFGIGFILFFTLNKLIKIRVLPEEEELGLNIVEHGAKSAWIDLMRGLSAQSKGDFTNKLPVEFGTEAGSAASVFNEVSLKLGKLIHLIQVSSFEVFKVGNEMQEKAAQLKTLAESQQERMSKSESSLSLVSKNIGKIKNESLEQKQLASFVSEKVLQLVEDYKSMKFKIEESYLSSISSDSYTKNGKKNISLTIAGIKRIKNVSKSILSMLKSLNQISSQLSILSLNASIEAVRSGDSNNGFVVVAEAITKLSEKTIHINRELSNLFKDMEESVILGEKNLKTTVSEFRKLFKSLDKIKSNLNGLDENRKVHDEILEQILSSQNELQTLSESIFRGVENTSNYETLLKEDVSYAIQNTNSFVETAKSTNSNSELLNKKAKILEKSISRFKIPDFKDIPELDINQI